ncbi:hypothetical protein, partial [Enterococcus gallinarum]|uniref:hypothetical protein n=1 Tax=Enterococcus gallinarum TaxID=1353 RepID=UPI001C8E770D
TLTVSSCRRSSHPRRLIVKDNRNSIRKEVLHLIKFVKKTVAIPLVERMTKGVELPSNLKTVLPSDATLTTEDLKLIDSL